MKIEKGVFCLVVFGIFLFYNLHAVHAYLGLSPALVEVDFEPEMKFFVNFNVLGGDANQKMEVYASGDLVEYTRFDKTLLNGPGGFTAYVELPKNVSKPGKNNLFIRIRELKNPGAGISTRLEIGALIIMKVPYPGKYAEIKSFSINDVNENEPVNFLAEVQNLGNLDVASSVSVNIDSNGKHFETLDLGSRAMAPRSSETFAKTLEKNHYKQGIYNATAILDYGDKERILKSEKSFRVGGLFVEIIDWSFDFIKGKINEFRIEVESKWNNDIKNVYAEINITKNNNQSDFFKTPSIELKKWEKAKLKGFFNAENLESGNYKANITVFYEDKTNSKIVNIKISSPEGRIILIYIIIACVALILVLVAIIIFFVIKNKKFIGLKPEGFSQPPKRKTRLKGQGIEPFWSNKKNKGARKRK